MADKKEHNNPTPEEEKALFSNLEFSYSKSKDEVWAALDKQLDAAPKAITQPPKGKVVRMNRLSLSIAASLVLILSAGLFARFYTTTVKVAPGEFTSHTLPDGSEVHLNAATSIKYAPYWWSVNREVKLQGEAYFVVAKGEKFTVASTMGSTEVLGTEFNVYARGDDFQVYCQEGRVRVTSEMVIEETTNEVIITQGEVAELNLNRLYKTSANIKEGDGPTKDAILSWRTGTFMFQGTPLNKVFEELARHYGMAIELSLEDSYNDLALFAIFPRSYSLEEALDIVCTTLGLSFEKTGDRVYLIKPR